MLESMRDHPGDFIDRDLVLPVTAACTRAARVDVASQCIWFMILFQYDADELTLHALDVVAINEEK